MVVARRIFEFSLMFGIENICLVVWGGCCEGNYKRRRFAFVDFCSSIANVLRTLLSLLFNSRPKLPNCKVTSTTKMLNCLRQEMNWTQWEPHKYGFCFRFSLVLMVFFCSKLNFFFCFCFWFLVWKKKQTKLDTHKKLTVKRREIKTLQAKIGTKADDGSGSDSELLSDDGGNLNSFFFYFKK